MRTVRYKESNATLWRNPERGLYAIHYLPSSEYSGHSATPRVLGWICDGNYSTIILKLVLVDFKHSSIPEDYLNRVRELFRRIREAGMKIILRVTYNEHMGEEDTPIDTVLEHIRQLGSVLEENKDIIMAMQAGFVGAWGEWHHSTNDLTAPENMRRIQEALMENVPEEIKIMFRRPSFLMSWYPRALTAQEANSGTPHSRAGFHDDCFNWNVTDMGTFSRDETERDAQTAYLEQSTRYTVTAGEMCSDDVAQNPESTTSCANGIAMAERFHYSMLGNQIRGPWFDHIEKLPVEVYQEQGCWDEFQRRLGYRFVLEEAKLPERVRPRDDLNLTLTIANRGFAATVNERPVFLVLKKGDREYRIRVDTDPRTWYGGEETTLHIGAKLSDEMEPGTYDLYLWLPDRSPNLRDDPRYVIALANEGVWNEAEGYNRLGTVEIAE